MMSLGMGYLKFYRDRRPIFEEIAWGCQISRGGVRREGGRHMHETIRANSPSQLLLHSRVRKGGDFQYNTIDV